MPRNRQFRDRAADSPPGAAGSGKKLTYNLTALSSAAVLAVYSAGYLRTRAAAERFEHAELPQRPDGPAFLSPASARPALRPASVESPAPVTIAPQRSPTSTTSNAVPSSSRPVAWETASAATTSSVADPTPAPADTHTAAPTEEAAVAPVAAAASTAAQPPLSTQPVTEHAGAEPAAATSAQAVAPGAQTNPAVPPARPAAPRFKDGVYKGWGSCRHGDIEATVTITEGRILSAAISQCWTRYSCSWISPLPPQVAARQSPEVDYVSGATESTYAFYYAVLEALHKARQGS